MPACCGSNCAICLALRVLLAICLALNESRVGFIAQSTLRREARPIGARCLSRTIKPTLPNRVIAAAVLASISIEVWRWRSGTLQTVVKRLFPFGGYLRPGNPGVDARSVGLSAVAPTPISPLPHACKRPELARRHESRKKFSSKTSESYREPQTLWVSEVVLLDLLSFWPESFTKFTDWWIYLVVGPHCLFVSILLLKWINKLSCTL